MATLECSALVEIPPGGMDKSNVLSLSPIQISVVVDGFMDQLEGIKNGKVPSWRHEAYKKSCRHRNALKYTFYATQWLTTAQFNGLSSYLVSKFCQQSMKFGYVMDVLLAEAVIRLIATCCKVELEKAERMMMTQCDHEEDTGKKFNQDPVETYDGEVPNAETLETSLLPKIIKVHKEELQAAANSFKTVIGKGTFGTVYRGQFKQEEVAIKVLYSSETELPLCMVPCILIEVYNLTRFRHSNLIFLLGYCEDPPSLIYPYMANMSLHVCLHEHINMSKCSLSWDQRAHILCGTACGLSYLHGCNPPFIHQCLKSQNVLLDENLNAKVADFGLAIPQPMQVGSTQVITTTTSFLPSNRGYLAPEYLEVQVGPYTDVYSYGVVCLETYTGVDVYSESREERKLADHCTQSNMLEDLPVCKTMCDVNAGNPSDIMAITFMGVSKKCIHHNYKRRCNLSEVICMWNSISADGKKYS